MVSFPSRLFLSMGFLFWRQDSLIVIIGKTVSLCWAVFKSGISSNLIISYCVYIEWMPIFGSEELRYLGAVSISRCCLTSIGIPMLKIRRSRDRLIFNIGTPCMGKTGDLVGSCRWISIAMTPGGIPVSSQWLRPLLARHQCPQLPDGRP